MRLMSFALTTVQFWRREKTVTRRLEWRDLKPGQLLLGVRQCQGIARGQHAQPLGIIRVESARREWLSTITQDDVDREGFPGMRPADFVRMFCENMKCPSQTIVTRIGFSYVPGGRFPVTGICRNCGCVEEEACFSEEHGACWWVNDAGHAAPRATSLCSHCFHGYECAIPDREIFAEMSQS